MTDEDRKQMFAELDSTLRECLLCSKYAAEDRANTTAFRTVQRLLKVATSVAKEIARKQ